MEVNIAARDQFLPYLHREQRWACIVAHRRAGKTVACIQDLLRDALTTTKVQPRYAYLGPTYAQAKDVAWAYLTEYASKIPGTVLSAGELSVTLNTANKPRIRLYGAENYDRLRGLYLDGIVIDEAGDIDPRAWSEVLRPALSDRKGWATFIGTPKGRNEFARIYERSRVDEDWFSLALRASETGLIDADELEDAKKSMSPEQYAQEYECSFDASTVGSYFGPQMQDAEKAGRIGKAPYDGGNAVHTAWDLGIGDATAIWFFQRIGLETRLIDYIEESGVGLDWYAKQLSERPYAYGTHLLPHDAGNDQLATGKSLAATLADLGVRGIVLPRMDVENGIEQVRKLLPSCWFDLERCKRGIDCLRMYRAEYDHKRSALRPRPVHDWTSHGADAFRYLAMGLDRCEEGFAGSFGREIEYPAVGLA